MSENEALLQKIDVLNRENRALLGELAKLQGERQDSAELASYIHHLQSIAQLNDALESREALEERLDAAMGVVLDIFDTDRAWLLYPCRPGVTHFEIPIEQTRPEWPGARQMGVRVPVAPDSPLLMPMVLEARGPVAFGPGSGRALPEASKGFGVRSEVEMVIRPRVGDPWVFGLHQCGRDRVWSEGELKLFSDLGHRLSDAIGNFLFARNIEANEARMRQKQRLESLGLLAGGVAHDFNNLLATILGNAELALMAQPREAEVIEALSDISTAAHSAAEMCKQLLAFSGKGRVPLEPVALNTCIKRFANLLKVSVASNATFALDLDTGLPPILAEPSQIQQVLLNLVINGSDALRGDEGVVTISTRLQRIDQTVLDTALFAEGARPGLCVCVAVSDTGSGMDAHVLEQIFDPFFSTKAEGRGLGLVSVLGVVRSHRGVLCVHTEPGRGTRFEVFLPLALGEPTPSRNTATATRRTRMVFRNKHILVADADPLIRALCQNVLERFGCLVSTASDRQLATDLFTTRREDPFDVVIIDLDTVAPGSELLQMMREAQPQLKVLTLGGPDSQDAVPPQSEMVGYLDKPFSADHLIDGLRSLLGVR